MKDSQSRRKPSRGLFATTGRASARAILPSLVSVVCLAACSGAPPAPELPLTAASGPQRDLASFADAPAQQACFDRSDEGHTAIVDAHFHPRPFGGSAIPPDELSRYFDRLGVRFVNYFGIGQALPLDSACTYYLDCVGTTAKPSIRNDVINAVEISQQSTSNLHITLSMTFMDLAHPEDAESIIALYDREFPDMFSWAGELNVIKQALLGNGHEPATTESIAAWAPFMSILGERNIPVTLHADLGNDANPTAFLPLMDQVLESYPDNTIVWAHMGLSKELTTMDPDQHISIMKQRLDAHPNLMLDISWDVLYNAYHRWGDRFVAFFNDYSDRILAGSDFVAAGSKEFADYAKELDVTSRVLGFLSDEAFRNIALGENYFRLMNLDYHAPMVCAASDQGQSQRPDPV